MCSSRSFKDNARQAAEFYQSVFGGELNVSNFADFGASEDPADADLVMHSQLETPSGFTIMAADTPSHLEYNPGTNIMVSLSGSHAEDAELRGYWDKLADGGRIEQPLT
ncbi:VOC family protein, partial [Rhizobium johnstonii]|uniref:VOC family protein n=1 Tax=Rhizobium johnstonii TaxID=3019933 RepID=UPI003F9D5E7B